MDQVPEVIELVCLEGGEDEIQHHLSVSPGTLVQLLHNLGLFQRFGDGGVV